MGMKSYKLFFIHRLQLRCAKLKPGGLFLASINFIEVPGNKESFLRYAYSFVVWKCPSISIHHDQSF